MGRLTLAQARTLLSIPLNQLTEEQKKLLPQAMVVAANSGFKRPAHG